jgi:serine/threonine protein kinase
MEAPQINIMERIDSGGIAEVFRGTLEASSGLKRTVAVKRILPHLALDKGFRKIFEREIFLIAQLKHPSIVQVHYSGEHSGYLYLVMEFIDGVNLTQLLVHCQKNSLRIPIEVSCAIVSQIARGIDYAYNKVLNKDGNPLRIIHRDINPRNVMLSYTGGVKVIDFGIAKALAHSQSGHSQGFRGTYGYCSPEQIRSDTIDHPTDIFSMGVVLWEMLAQRPLFAGKPHEILKKIVTMSSEPPSVLQPDIPPELDEIVLRSLRKSPHERFESARAMYLSLDQFIKKNYPNFKPDSLGVYVNQLFEEQKASQALARRQSDNSLSDSFTMKADSFLSYDYGATIHSNDTSTRVLKKAGTLRSHSGLRTIMLFLIPTILGVVIGFSYFQFSKGNQPKQTETQPVAHRISESVNPNAVPSLFMWLQSSNLQGEMGEPVGLWADKKRTESSVGQTLADQKPFFLPNAIQGYPVVHFRHDHLTFPGMQQQLKDSDGLSIIYVGRTGELNFARNIWSLQQSIGSPKAQLLDLLSGGYTEDGAFSIGTESSQALLSEPDLISREIFHISSLVVTRNSIALFLNGYLILKKNLSEKLNIQNITQLMLGCSAYDMTKEGCFNGALTDFLVFSEALNDRNRMQVENFFSDRYTLDLVH